MRLYEWAARPLTAAVKGYAPEFITRGKGSGGIRAACAAEVQAGRLVRALPDWSLPTVPVSATFLERRHLPRRIRAFIDQMAEAIQGQPP